MSYHYTYIWDKKTDQLTPVDVDDERWIVTPENFEERNRVAQTQVERYWFSTVFLGYNMAFQDHPPICFETMMFHRWGKPPEDWEFQWRHSSGYNAREIHEFLVCLARRYILKSPQVRRRNFLEILGRVL